MKARLPRRKYKVVGGVFFLSTLVIVLFVRYPLSASAVSVARVERGRFVRQVEALGELQAVKTTPIVTPTDVRRHQTIAELAPDGQYVKTGQTIVIFDATVASTELVDGHADRRTAENKIAQIHAAGERTRRGLALDRERANEDRERAEDVSPTEEDIYSRHEIIESRVDRTLLEKKTAIATQKFETNTSLHRADLSLGLIERRKAEIKIQEAEAALKSLRITAPHDGLLMLARSWRGEIMAVGQQVWPGQKIAEIPDLSELEAKVYVLEADAGGLAVGREARLVIEGRPGNEYAAHVSRIDALAKPRHSGSPVKYFEVYLAFANKEEGAALKLGQKVRARIIIEEIEDVLTVPRGALIDRDGQRVVYRLEDGRFRPVEVSVGSLSVGLAVITGGLADGDRVALRDPTRPLSEILKARGTGESTSGATKER